MHRLVSIGEFFSGSFPHRPNDLKVWKFIEDTVATQYNKVVAILNL